jgi:hypothetical protein
MKKYLFIAGGIIALLVAVIFTLQAKPSNHHMLLYYSYTCPHCEAIRAYIQQNHLHEKIDFDEKEVLKNQKNRQELIDHVHECGLPDDSIAVPFFWTGFACLSGVPDIENFLREKQKAP